LQSNATFGVWMIVIYIRLVKSIFIIFVGFFVNLFSFWS